MGGLSDQHRVRPHNDSRWASLLLHSYRFLSTHFTKGIYDLLSKLFFLGYLQSLILWICYPYLIAKFFRRVPLTGNILWGRCDKAALVKTCWRIVVYGPLYTGLSNHLYHTFCLRNMKLTLKHTWSQTFGLSLVVCGPSPLSEPFACLPFSWNFSPVIGSRNGLSVSLELLNCRVVSWIQNMLARRHLLLSNILACRLDCLLGYIWKVLESYNRRCRLVWCWRPCLLFGFVILRHVEQGIVW